MNENIIALISPENGYQVHMPSRYNCPWVTMQFSKEGYFWPGEYAWIFKFITHPPRSKFGWWLTPTPMSRMRWHQRACSLDKLNLIFKINWTNWKKIEFAWKEFQTCVPWIWMCVFQQIKQSNSINTMPFY